MTAPRTLPRVLFVDDEELLLQALGRQVRDLVDADLCSNPLTAIDRLAASAAGPDNGYAAVVSDMRMPDMDGAALLAHAQVICPQATRLLLTGHADLDSAVTAVNTGAIFRFLTKPCATPVLHTAIEDALAQHQLVRDQRELLERTLRGAVEALVETLAMTHPHAFARAARLRRLTRDLAERLQLPQRWAAEIAAQFAEIGVVTLPPDALEALIRGSSPNAAVSRMLAALPDIADRLLSRIPRLEPVRDIVRAQQPVDHLDSDRLAGAHLSVLVVQAVREYDALTARGYQPANAIGVLRQRPHHDARVLDVLTDLVAADDAAQVRAVPVVDLRPGMTIAADLRTTTGMLLVAHGHVLTEELLTRIHNFDTLTGLATTPLVAVRSGQS